MNKVKIKPTAVVTIVRANGDKQQVKAQVKTQVEERIEAEQSSEEEDTK